MTRQTKQLVEAALYGAGDRRRYTLDSPVLSDVWGQFFEQPWNRPSLLLEPWLDATAFSVAERLTTQPIDAQASAISYNRTIVVANLTLTELVDAIIPLTGWYGEVLRDGRWTDHAGIAPPLPSADQMWDDLSVTDRREPYLREPLLTPYPFTRLLGLIRIVGLILALELEGVDEPLRGGIRSELVDLSEGREPRASEARGRLAEYVLAGWNGSRLLLPLPVGKIIYAVNRNRPAKLAIQQSVRTVKGDAASSLFSIDCAALTWAVIDSGIDADHEAFAPTGSAPGPDRLARSRIRETYDFAYLREVLTSGMSGPLPAHVANIHLPGVDDADGSKAAALRAELAARITRGRQLDWELLRPFLRIGHDASYVKPADPHGTHVAGILAADWDRGGDRMVGMCPTLNLIDIRVCREDGTSDEFIIMSALQFVRHLNANSDRVAVHGVNMSLSLEHDASVYACGRTPVCEEAERTVSTGVVVVAAAGNHGYRRILAENSQPFDQYCPVSITDPGNAEAVITVGSTHRLEPHSYGVSYFSSRGPTGDGRVKPDLVAPGEKIFAPAPNNEAMRLDGTSMAAPHVSGAAAMLMARHVELIGQPQRIKDILRATATDLGREPYFQGKGLVDVLRAIQSV